MVGAIKWAIDNGAARSVRSFELVLPVRGIVDVIRGPSLGCYEVPRTARLRPAAEPVARPGEARPPFTRCA